MDYSSTFNTASSIFHTTMDVAEAAISVASVPIGTAAAALYSAMGTGYMGLGYSANTAMWVGGGVGLVALALTSYWAYKSIKNVFAKSAETPEPEKTAPPVDFNSGLAPA